MSLSVNWPKRFILRRMEQAVVLAIIAAVAGIHLLADHKLVVLNFFYVPVLAVAFFFGRRLGALTVLLCFLLVLASALLSPHAYNIQVTPQLLALDLAIWAGFLALAVLLVGSLAEWRRQHLLGPPPEQPEPFHAERRRFVRVKAEVPVKYWYLSESGAPLRPRPCEGVACRISKSGIELMGEVPPEDLLPKLILQRVPIYVEVSLPTTDTPVGAVARVVWVQPRTVKPPKYRLGLEFREITRSDEDKIVDYIINERIRVQEFSREEESDLAAVMSG